MKNIGLAAEHYQIMEENRKRAQEECERKLTLASINEESIAGEKLRGFRLGLVCV